MPAEAAPAALSYVKLPQMCSACPYTVFRLTIASAVGCAMVAFISQGVYGSYEDAIEHMVHKKDVFIPNEENHRTYMKIYGKAYSHLASRLKPIEKYLHHFQTGGH